MQFFKISLSIFHSIATQFLSSATDWVSNVISHLLGAQISEELLLIPAKLVTFSCVLISWWSQAEALGPLCFAGQLLGVLGQREELTGPTDLCGRWHSCRCDTRLKVLALYNDVGGSGKAGRGVLSVDPVKSFLGGPYSGPRQRSSWRWVGWRAWECFTHL